MKPKNAILGASLFAAIGIISFAYIAFRQTSQSSTSKQVVVKSCKSSKEIFSERDQKCILPKSETEARAVIGWNDLKQAQDRGEALVKVDLQFSKPISRDAFERILKATQAQSASNLGLFFPDIEGGMSVGAKTEVAPVTIQALIQAAKADTASKYSSFHQEPAASFPKRFNAAIDQNQEQYSAIDLTAKPSDLLSSWGQFVEIEAINLVLIN